MSDPDATARRAEAKRWLAIADQDIAAAHLCLAASPPLAAIAAYHCQQATEKIIKGLLVAAGVAFPKSHDLAALTALATPHYPALAGALGALAPITVWGFAYRYPAEEDVESPPSQAELNRCLGDITTLLRSAAAVT